MSGDTNHRSLPEATHTDATAPHTREVGSPMEVSFLLGIARGTGWTAVAVGRDPTSVRQSLDTTIAAIPNLVRAAHSAQKPRRRIVLE